MSKKPVVQPPVIDAEFSVIHDPAWPELPPKQKPPKVPMLQTDLEFVGQLIVAVLIMAVAGHFTGLY